MFLGLLVHILFHKFKEKTIFFSPFPLLQTLGITDSKSPPDGVGNNGSRTVIMLLKSDWLPVINYRLISLLLNPATHTNIRTLLKTNNKIV